MKKVFSGCYLVLALAFIYVPIFVLVIYSFTDSKIIGDWNGFSLELYEKLFGYGNGSYFRMVKIIALTTNRSCAKRGDNGSKN